MTGPQNYQAAERLAQKAEAHLNDGDNEGAAVWASLARTHAILASAAAHHARRVGDLGMARDCQQQAVRQLNLARSYELNPLKHRAAPPPRAGGVRAEPGPIARKPSPVSRSAVDSALIERDRRITEVAIARRSDHLVTAIHARFLT